MEKEGNTEADDKLNLSIVCKAWRENIFNILK